MTIQLTELMLKGSLPAVREQAQALVYKSVARHAGAKFQVL